MIIRPVDPAYRACLKPIGYTRNRRQGVLATGVARTNETVASATKALLKSAILFASCGSEPPVGLEIGSASKTSAAVVL